MGKKLIITEKPSVSRDIVGALGGFKESDGGEYWESDNYICTFAVGHLIGLAEPEDIDPSYKRWTMNNLPIIPEKFQLKAKDGQNKRLNVIKRLVKRNDVDGLINACDAAREGELIFREILEYLEIEKPFLRLWLQSMTKDAIKEGFANLLPAEKVHGLGAAAECRSKADWLIGMNATRALSVRLRTRSQKGAWSAGRVQTPTLTLLVDRELEILEFEPEDYWQISGKFKSDTHEYEGLYFDHEFKRDEQESNLKSDRIFDKVRALEIVNKVQGQPGLATETRKPRQSKAPILFNLTALQKAMSSRYGFSSKRTLQAAQRCYESHKVLTYPRTSSACLPEDYKNEVPKIFSFLASTASYGKHSQYLIDNGLENEKLVFNNAGVSDHFAIIPTGHWSDRLEGDDHKVFDTVVRRFLAAFYPPAVYDKVERITIVNGCHFKTGPVETLVKSGWLGVYEKMEEDKQKQTPLPPLIRGQQEAKDVPVSLIEAPMTDHQTKPPPRIGEARLLSLMEHAGRHVEDGELASALMSAEGLGTAATRADIIENLKTKEYVDSNLRPTAKGIRLIDTLKRIGASRLTSPELTARLELHLNEVEEKKRTGQEFLTEVSDYITDVVEHARSFDFDLIYPNENPLGDCPVCKDKKVYEKTWFYACESNQRDSTNGCGLLMWKDTYGRFLDRKSARQLLSKGETEEVDGFKNANGQSYKGKMLLEGTRISVKPTGAEIPADAATFSVNAEPLGLCPINATKGEKIPVIETATHFIAETKEKALKEGDFKAPGFILPRMICKREIKREEAIEMISTGETPLITDFISKKGRPFKAKLKIKPDGRHEFEFPPREPKKPKASANEAAGADTDESTTPTPVKANKKKASKKTTSKASKNASIDDETPF